MNSTQRSTIQEKAKGTYQRNQSIRLLYAEYGNMAELGRQFKLSRQAIRKIIMRVNDGKTS